MAIEHAKKFLSDLRSDESLAEQADDAYVAALLSVAQKAGYDVTESDLRAAMDAAGSGELSDGDLESVAGGSTFNTADVSSNFNTAGFGSFFNSFSKKGFLG